MKISKKSFSKILKEEILKIKPKNKKEGLSELYGMIYSKNSLKSKNIYFRSELVHIASRVEEDLELIKDLKYTISYIKSNKITNQKIYVIKIENQFEIIKNIFKDLDDTWILKGFFLSSGYIKDPNKGYSLDIFVEKEDSSYILYDILKQMDINVLMSKKKENRIVYVRNSENILDILIKLDATSVFFKYEEIAITKEMNLKVIRSMNYEIANEYKKLKTSNEQIKLINKIKEKIGLENLSDILRQTCMYRLENEELSLQELANLLNISKSGLRNRFRRLEEIYDAIR